MGRVSADPLADKPRRSYVSATRTKRAQKTRKRVIEAATRLFVQQGYATTTMRAIADEAGVSVPTVELLFGTKAQLLHVVIDVAVAGDDEPVPVLSRAWAADAQSARDLADSPAGGTGVGHACARCRGGRAPTRFSSIS